MNTPATALLTRTASALNSLMRMWEQDPASEDLESDADMLVMLSGMVGGYATETDDGE